MIFSEIALLPNVLSYRGKGYPEGYSSWAFTEKPGDPGSVSDVRISGIAACKKYWDL